MAATATTAPSRPGRRQLGMAALALGALGVVFGDIGTSPLYALQTVFSADHQAVKATSGDVYGVISLVFWTVTLIVSVEFVTFIMRADNDGEGGLMALIALVMGATLRRARLKGALIAIGMLGVALFYGDGIITPAISVLSAVEGIKVAVPGLSSLVLPLTIAVLVALFAIQHYGTHRIGSVFGPVMLVWFAILAAAGLRGVVNHPHILNALLPSHALEFFGRHPGTAFVALGSIVLTITGAEALYADMGHFGRPPIARAWFFVVFPALTLNYMGQGALILETPTAIESPFFLLLPHWSRVPMVLLATVATVIASQAVISGAFSVTRQAIQLGFLPRLYIRHTSTREIGQIYIPAVNWVLLAAVIGLVLGFGSSTDLGSAYGIAVTGTITADTLLFLVVVRVLWRKPGWLVGLGAVVFFTIDFAFLGANMTKVAHGGWFPLTVAALVFTVFATWRRGAEKLHSERIEEEGPLPAFVAELRAADPPVIRIPGTAVYLNARRETAPIALHRTVTHGRTLRATAVILSIETTKAPYVPESERLVADEVRYRAEGIVHLTARFGFQDVTDVPRALALAAETGLVRDVDVDGAVYYLSQVFVTPTGAAGMRTWRKRLFAAMYRNSASPVEYFHLPRERTVTLGSAIEL